jgi:hypothetical protein
MVYSSLRFLGAAQKYDTKLGDLAIQSISAMPQYANKSHEELRLEDMRRGGCLHSITRVTTNAIALLMDRVQSES